jgi:hypothetical protein
MNENNIKILRILITQDGYCSYHNQEINMIRCACIENMELEKCGAYGICKSLQRNGSWIKYDSVEKDRRILLLELLTPEELFEILL